MKIGYFHVAPRYSPGSPAMVPERTALRVARDEAEGFEATLWGAYGEARQEEALKLGLEGVVEHRRERAGGWDVEDLLTGRTCRREDIRADHLRPGDKVLRAISGLTELSRPVTVGETYWGKSSVVFKSPDLDPREGLVTFLKRDLVRVERLTTKES